MSWGWYSYDMDDPDNDYCAKTDIHDTAPFIAMKEPTETSALVMGMRCTAAWMTILTVASPTGCAARTILQATGALGKSANADGCGAPSAAPQLLCLAP